MPAIDLYQLPASGPCRAVLMTAQHIGVEVNKKNVNLLEGEQMKPEFLEMNPQHCVPTIDDGGFYLWESRAIQAYLVNKYAPDSPIYPKDAQARAVVDRMLYFDIGTLYKAESEYLMNPQHCAPTMDDGGFYLCESRAIQAYLVNKYSPDSPLYPKDPKARAVVDRMLYFDIGTLYKSLYEYLSPQMYLAAPPDSEKEEVFKKALDLLEGFLSKTPYVAGNQLTIADLSLLAGLSFSEVMEYNLNPYPKICAWLQKLKSEVPNYKEINDEPLKQFREWLKSRNFLLRP